MSGIRLDMNSPKLRFVLGIWLIALGVLSVIAMLTACQVSPMNYVDGVPNLDHVEGGIYRSGQIDTVEGWTRIRQLAGTRLVHVLKLNYDTEGDDDLAVLMGFDVHELSIQPQGDQAALADVEAMFRRPDQSKLDEAERLLESSGPNDFWLVHCTHDQDRTGLVVGRYRVLHDGWRKGRAFREALDHHFHPELVGLVQAWIETKETDGIGSVTESLYSNGAAYFSNFGGDVRFGSSNQSVVPAGCEAPNLDTASSCLDGYDLRFNGCRWSCQPMLQMGH